MLKEINLSDVPEKVEFGCELTPDGAFAESTVLDFNNSGMMIAEVEGWPSGDPKTSKQASRCYTMLKNKVKKHKLVGIDVLLRGRRIFIQKTIIYKMNEGERDA